MKTNPKSPAELRELIRNGKWTTPTSGAASGYLQANLVMLPAEEAFNFLLFCVRNPKPCPILDVLKPGQVEPIIAPGADLRTDLPRYKIFEKGMEWIISKFFYLTGSTIFNMQGTAGKDAQNTFQPAGVKPEFLG